MTDSASRYELPAGEARLKFKQAQRLLREGDAPAASAAFGEVLNKW